MRILYKRPRGLWLACLAAVPLLTGLTCQAQDTLTNGLVAYWSFDNSDFKDSIGIADGTAHGTEPIAFVAGKTGFGKAIQLDGTDQYVEITGRNEGYDPDELAMAGGSISISIWFTVDAFDKSWQALIAKGENNNWRVARNSSTSGVSYAGGLTDALGDVDVSDGNWHHLVAISDATGAAWGTAIYIDGELDGSIAGAAALTSNGKSVMIGENPDSAGRQWRGQVDDVGIWNRVLTEAEIKDLYSGGTGRPITNPLLDSDNDGLPDPWETQYGLNPNDASDAAKDCNNNGVTNLDEYKAGLDPCDAEPPEVVSTDGSADFLAFKLTFSEGLDPSTATNLANYALSPSLAINAATYANKVVTLTTATQAVGGTYTLALQGLKDLSKNEVPAGTTVPLNAYVMTKQGLLKWSYWGDATGGAQIAGTAVQGLLDDPRYPASPDLVRPVYSFNSRDAFPDDTHEYFGATMEGYITPKASGSYRFFIYSDDASELWLSTDDTEANLAKIAEETGCCNFFTEPAATYEEMPRTSNPIALTAGKSYFVRMIYKEGTGGDYGQVAWRKEGDATPAGKLAPIPAGFLSAAVELPGPAPVPPAPMPLLDFAFDEGSGTNTVDAANGLVGILGVGMGVDSGNVPMTVTNNPAGAANDRALSLNAGNATRQSALLVNDQIAPILAFATNAPFTIEAWVNREADDARTYEGLAAYGRSHKFGLNNGQLQFTLYGIVDINSGLVLPTGEWHHVAAVWTPGTGVEFFYDGTSLTNIAETRVPRAYQNNVLTIGAENIGATAMANTFQGLIDRFRIHSAALTADQLDAVAATPAAVLGSTVVAYNFNQATHPYPSQGTVARPAVPNSAPAWTNDTPSGQEGDSALSFAPGTQVIVADPNSRVQLDPAYPDFTMQAWLNFQGNPATRQVFYFNNGPGGALSFSVFTNRTLFVTTLGILDRDSNAKVPDDGAWHHVAVVHENGKEFRFYVDGLLADTKAYTSGVNFTRTNQVFYLGSEPTFGLQYTGKLDRMKVTQGALTPDEFDYPALPTPPSIVSAGAVGSAVGVVFDMAVDAATAVNPGHYEVSGATVTSAKLIAPNYVLLGVSAVPTGAFTVTARRISSTFGDVMTAPATVEAAAGSTIPSGLAAYWSFDGHLLDSIDGFDGAARGSPGVAFADGVAGFGKALKLTGTNYVEIPGSSNALRFAKGSLSIAGWFKVEAFDKDWQALIAKGEGTNYRIARRASTGSIAYAGGVGEGAEDVPSVNDGKWHHFVAVTDAQRAEFGTALYVDGVRYGVMADAAVLAAGTANLFIGENPESLNRQFKGEMDDIGLWNRVLAPEEIAILYKGGQGMPVSALPGVITPIPANRPYTIGLNFGADEYSGGNQGTLAPSSAAGAVPQANWNNLTGANGTSTNVIVADTAYETPADTAVVVNWVSNGTWSSTGRGEENIQLTGADRALMIGYLDTGNATTTSVTITNIPAELTSSGYDVYVYALGGVGGRGGGYRVLDAATGAVLKDYVRVVSMTNSTTFVEAPIDAGSTNFAAGNYMVFMDLTASALKVEATTEAGYGFSGTPRAPLNAIQLVAVAPVGKLISIDFGAEGLVITFTGQLQSADTVVGPWTNVEGASPITVQPTGNAKFYRVQQ